MDQNARCRILADAVAVLLKDGIRLSSGDMDYLESTFMIRSAAGLQQLLAEGDSDETDTLLELVFFPDDAVRAGLETVLEQNRYQPKDCRTVQQLLAQQVPKVSLTLSERELPVSVQVPPWAWLAFVQRLHIDRVLDHRLVTDVDECIAEPGRNLVKVALRDSGFPLTNDTRQCLSTVIRSHTGPGDSLPGFLRFTAGILKEADTAVDILGCLTDRKKFLIRNLHKARQAQKYLQNNTVETMRAQGRSPFFFDTHRAREEMKKIDKLCRILYGRTLDVDAFAPVEQCLVDPGEPAADILRKLT